MEIDLRTGRAAMEFGGRRFLVGTIQWDELGALARFAHLGPPFVRRELVRLAVHEEGGPPAEAAEEEILAAVAMWLATAGREAPLDLDPANIAAATRDVCRSLRIAPAELDGRPAPDVAALWRSCAPVDEGPAADTAGRVAEEPAAAEEPAGAGDEDGYTRILVVPDEEPPGPVDPEDGTEPRTGGPEDASTPPDQIAAAASSPVTAEASPRVSETAPAARRPRHGEDAWPQEQGRMPRPGGLRFRIVPPSSRPEPGASPSAAPFPAGPPSGADNTASRRSLVTEARPGPGAETVTTAAPPGRPVLAATPRRTSRLPVVGAAASPLREDSVLRPSTVRFTQDEHGLPIASGAAEMRPSRNAAALQGSPSWTGLELDLPGLDGWETLFDGLAERLEEAAAQLGIDLEG
jgi:hypothetical protein